MFFSSAGKANVLYRVFGPAFVVSWRGGEGTSFLSDLETASFSVPARLCPWCTKSPLLKIFIFLTIFRPQ